ncbi:MAG: hypothetical protein R2909_12005 [Gemmatimonadales bacterium]
MRQRIDQVLSDVVMPRTGGPALVAALRLARLPALFISGGPSGPLGIPSRDRVLRKPFMVEDLRRAVRDVLATSPGQGQRDPISLSYQRAKIPALKPVRSGTARS